MTTEQRHFTPSVQNVTNFKEYFLQYDGLNHVSQELGFSLFKRYTCKAGCKMCYLQNDWIADEDFGIFIPKEIDDHTEARLLSFFEAFSDVGTYDDLAYLKRAHPHLYEFYKKHSHRLVNTSMSDTAFIQQYPLLMNELNFKGIYEITFSDVFLNKKSGGLAHDIVNMLKPLHAKMPLLKIKVVRITQEGEKSDAVKKVVDYAHSIGIAVGLQDDIVKGDNNKLSLDVADYQELNYFAQGSEPMQVLSEITYLQYTSSFMTLTDTVSPTSVPFFDVLSTDDISVFLYNSLDAKLKTYTRYTKEMDNTCGNKLFDYFAYVSTSVVLHPKFNFIPRMSLKPWTAMYHKLIAQGWTETKLGLYRPNGEPVTPIFTISTKPKQKIYHIPIKCTPVGATV
jgi:hypothetical protein